jgi:CRISPR-associated protein Csm3
MKLTGYRTITGIAKCETGLHIGGSSEQMEIGGVDLPIIKHPISGEPFIPGSSLKGKMRSQLEKKLGKIRENGEPCGCGQSDCMVCKVFGAHKNTKHNLGSTRILVRDASFTANTRNQYEELAKEKGIPYIERKVENLVLRTTGTAKDPRSQERVPAGAEFSIEIVLQVYDVDNNGNELVDFVKEGLRQVQNTYLGGFGSRGSGKVSFHDMKLDGAPFTL